MKTHVLLCMLLLTWFNNIAQPVIWGINSHYGTASGNSVAAGNIYSINGDGTNFIQHNYFNQDFAGENPFGALIQATNGKLYGTAYAGGNGNFGVIFSYDAATGTYTVLHSFDNTNGANPYGSLMQASNGKLYGMTNLGGLNSCGVLFSFDPVTNTYTNLVDFDFTNAAYPFGSLIQAVDGLLYGLSSSGGMYGAGNIFSYDISSNTITDVFNFDGSNGGFPLGDLLEANDEMLYGVAYGTLFKFDPATAGYSALYSIPGSQYATLIQADDGNLYGFDTYGSNNYGSIYSYDPILGVYSDVFDFNGLDNGGQPYGALIQATNGKLYGMTSVEGNNHLGTIFSYDISADNFIKIVDFSGVLNGASPAVGCRFIQATDGKLYAATTSGGGTPGDYGYSPGAGTLLSFDITTSACVKKIDFNGGTNGVYPGGGLMQASTGAIYSTTVYGGTNDCGVIFSFNPFNGTYTKVHDFDFTNGANPTGTLVQASNGILYGTAPNGGLGPYTFYGVLFSLNPAGNVFTNLFNFDGLSGAEPTGRLIQGTDGKIYGVTQKGGANDVGTLYSFDPVTSQVNKLHDFDITAGAFPVAGLIQSSTGLLYGITANGGGFESDWVFGETGGVGVLFSYDPLTNDFEDLMNFNDPSSNIAVVPNDLLLETSNGHLYGTTVSGGYNGNGVFYEFDQSVNFFNQIYDFNGIGYGAGVITEASDNKIYGVTSGLSTGNGLLYSYDPSTNTFDGPLDLGASDGLFSTTSILELSVPNSVLPVEGVNNAISISPNPARDIFNIDIDENLQKAVIEIYDEVGKKVYRSEIKNIEAQFSSSIFLKERPGIYLVKVTDGEKEYTSKLIIQ